MEPESIAAPLSEEFGNLPVETEPTPSEEPQEPETPAEPKEEPTPTEPELYELPDGRKVDAATLTKEWKENFLPDYTRKSQALAAKDTTKNNEPSQAVKEEWTPNTWEDVLKTAEQRAIEALERKEQERVQAQQAIETEVVAQLNEVKKIDPSLNENALFLHANKYGFRDLRVAHQNMKDMAELAKKVQTTTATNIAKRVDPVSSSPGATGARPDPSGFESASAYLRSLK